MSKTLAQRIGGIAGFAISQLPEQSENFAAEVAVEIEKGIADPETYPEFVDDAAGLLKSTTKNQHAHEMIDALADLLVHEDDESWFDEFGDAFRTFTEGMKARRERKKSEKENLLCASDRSIG